MPKDLDLAITIFFFAMGVFAVFVTAMAIAILGAMVLAVYKWSRAAWPWLVSYYRSQISREAGPRNIPDKGTPHE